VPRYRESKRTTFLDKEIKTGKILIADPFLQDGEFTRSIILLTSFEKDNTMGFVLNKPTDVKVHEVFADFPDFNSKVFIGGPVDQNLLFFVHICGDLIPNSIPITKNVYFGGDFETMKTLIETKKITNKDIRFFLGYAGWGEEQLKEEIHNEAWLVGGFKLSYLTTLKPNQMWHKAIKSEKPEYGVYSEFPFTPSLN
jgi:putative transcriptional regulator